MAHKAGVVLPHGGYRKSNFLQEERDSLSGDDSFVNAFFLLLETVWLIRWYKRHSCKQNIAEGSAAAELAG